MNEKKKPYRLDDQLPPKQRAAKLKQRDMLWRNKKSVAYTLAVSLKKGKLIIENEEYTSPIIYPNIHKLMTLKGDEVNELLKTPVKQGEPIVVETSTFTGYAVDVRNFDEVNCAYEWVKFHKPQARHIICACLVGSKRSIRQEEYEDDDEPSSGSKTSGLHERIKVTQYSLVCSPRI